MFKRVLKWLGAIIVVLVIVVAIFLTNLIWFRPWSLNLFYEKIFAEVLFDHPELLSALGLVEQFGITSHNGKLDDESRPSNNLNSIVLRRISRNCGSTRLIDNHNRSGFPRMCWSGFSSARSKAKNTSGTPTPLISSSECRTSSPPSWRTRTDC